MTAGAKRDRRNSTRSAAVMVMLALVVIAFAVLTWRHATTSLRVPVRAQRVGWPYSYGFYEPEPASDGGEQRWTARRGVIVLDAPTRHLMLTVLPNANAQRPGRNPLHMRVSVNRQVLIDGDAGGVTPLAKYVELPAIPRVMIEADVNRTFRPSEIGEQDDRDLGLLVQWRFLEQPPRRPPTEAGSD